MTNPASRLPVVVGPRGRFKNVRIFINPLPLISNAPSNNGMTIPGTYDRPTSNARKVLGLSAVSAIAPTNTGAQQAVAKPEVTPSKKSEPNVARPWSWVGRINIGNLN